MSASVYIKFWKVSISKCTIEKYLCGSESLWLIKILTAIQNENPRLNDGLNDQFPHFM